MGTRGKILVVDDQLVHREMLLGSLEEYDLRAVSGAAEARSTLESFSPDVILLDVELAEGTGYELCREIRENNKFAFSKIAFISSHSSVEKRLEGYQAGGDDFIVKPINAAEVAAKVQVLMRLKAAEEVNQLKRTFLSLIKHETMTPLSSIKGHCDILLQSKDVDLATVKSGLQVISDAANRLAELLQKIVLCTSLQDLQKTQLHPVEIATVVAELVQNKAVLVQAKSIGLRHSVASSTLMLNPQLISKAISFVLDNAIRYSPQGGGLELRGESRGDRYCLSMRDSGPGISEAVLKQLSEPFAVGDITHHSRGSGLSLFLTKRIVELHFGMLKITSPPEGGCLVEIFIRYP